MKIAVVGTGYVGLVTGTCLADIGHEVTCIDNDQHKIGQLKSGKIPIYEEGLKELVEKNEKFGRLQFTNDLNEAVSSSDVVFIAVGTPPRPQDGGADLSAFYSASREIARSARPGAVIVTKSTVPVGTGDTVESILRELQPNNKLYVVSNPEFLREGVAINDFMNPDRIVVGAQCSVSKAIMEQVYRPLTNRGIQMLITSRRSSELIKYSANALLATKIAFINEIADLCERAGADVTEVAQGIGQDGRIGSQFLNAGPGYGGSCFPKDTLALLKTAENLDVRLRIVEAVTGANEARKRAMGRRILERIGGAAGAKAKSVALLGLTFKPNTDDMRESPAINIAQALMDAGVTVKAFDPKGMAHAQHMMAGVRLVNDPYEAIRGSNALVIVTEWTLFRSLDMRRVKDLMVEPIVIDLRNFLDQREVEAAGLSYSGIGGVGANEAC